MPSPNYRLRPSATLLGTASRGETLTPENEPPASHSPTPDISEQLAHLTRSWRERLEPPTQTTGPSSRRRDIVTQEQFAHTIGYTVGWYRKLELGEQAGYSDDFLERVAAGFRLNDAEKTLLFLLAAGREPPAPLGAIGVSATSTLQRILDAQPWPTFIHTEAWDLVSVNQHMLDWFPWARPGANIMHWAFTSAEARVHLHRWKEDWAPQMIAEVRLALARSPDDERLTELITAILRTNREARALWQVPSSQTLLGQRKRYLNLPYHGKDEPIEIIAFEAFAPRRGRMAMIVPWLTHPSAAADS
jgi:transcriptional regulator with XRE-family HTH domain